MLVVKEIPEELTGSRPTSQKVCRSCGELKPLEDYHRTPVSRDGRQARCKACRNAEARIYRERRKTVEGNAERRAL